MQKVVINRFTRRINQLVQFMFPASSSFININPYFSISTKKRIQSIKNVFYSYIVLLTKLKQLRVLYLLEIANKMNNLIHITRQKSLFGN